MNVDQITELFKWMTVINIVVFLVSSILAVLFKGFVCRMHGLIFGIDKEKVPMILYGYLGLYRIIILVFNIVPYVSLLIITP